MKSRHGFMKINLLTVNEKVITNAINCLKSKNFAKIIRILIFFVF